MENLDFLFNCLLTLAIVFLVLSLLSLSMRILITVFPEKSSSDDAAVVAAITTHLNRVYPHTQITKMEEKK
ncbi:MAG: hypothetical protein WBN42_11795 [Ignavibacteriaceae bacterium]